MSPTRSPAGVVSSSERRSGNGSRKRVLILYVRAGAGHEHAARAVASAMQQIDPGAEPIVRDALDFSSKFLRAFYASTYNRMVARAPRVWGQLYHRSARAPIEGFRQELRTRITLWGCYGYLEAVRIFQPEAVLCTQFLPAEVFAFLRERGRVTVPVSCAITDFSVHPIWVYRGIDRYYVAADKVKEELVDTGVVSEDRIEVTGVPVDPKFSVRIPQAEARRAIGLDPDPGRLTVLLMGGGFGWGPIEGMLEVLLDLPEQVQVIAIAGRNERLRLRLAERVRGQEGRVKVYGFTDQVDLLLAGSDLILGKAGGLTSSESMARGVPMLVFQPIPGQEDRNCDFLQESGAAVRLHDLDELHYRLRHFLENPGHLAAMRERAASVGRPRAAFDVARSILHRLTPRAPGASMS
jgi:processive 1,2-diacylglycerol beta-glucosyltransferase